MKANITIIDDNDDLRTLMRMSLQAAGYYVIALSNGDELTEEKDKSDLYIIDLNLNGVSGLEICRRIKSQKYTAASPVVIIASANPDLRRLSMEVYADDMLSKPFTAKELLKKISEYFPEASGS